MLKVLTVAAAVVAAGAMAACSHAPFTGPLARSSGEPARLAFSDDGANAKLAYGVAAAQDAGFMLECAHGSGAVHLTQLGVARAAPRLRLSSDRSLSVVSATPQAFEGRALLVAELPADAPALAGFRRSGRLQLSSGEVRYDVSAREDQPKVERFFQACGAT